MARDAWRGVAVKAAGSAVARDPGIAVKAGKAQGRAAAFGRQASSGWPRSGGAFDPGKSPSVEGAEQGDSKGPSAATAPAAMGITRLALADWEFPSASDQQSPNIPAISTRSALVELWLISGCFGRLLKIRR